MGIPTVRDRVVQMAAVLVLGPIFEADLQPEQYAYRPDRSALDAVQQVHAWLKTGHTEGHETRLKAHIVNYADDFVICCRGTAVKAMSVMRAMMAKLKLTVNEAKTRRCRVWNESFDFLGYTIGKCYSPVTGASVPRYAAVAEEDRPGLPGDPCDDRPKHAVGRREGSN